MTTQASDSTLTSKPANNKIPDILNSFLQPAGNLSIDEKQKASSLIALALTFLFLSIIISLMTPMQNLIAGNGFTGINPGGTVTITIVIFTYFLSRTRFYKIGAYVMVIIPIIAVLASRTEQGITEIALFYLSLSVILTSLLLSARMTLISGIVVFAITIGVMVLQSDSGQPIVPVIPAFTVVTATVLTMTAYVREQNLKALILAQEKLENQIEIVEEARQRAERSDQVKSAFLASMSHELRTPLNAIINFTRFVIKGMLGEVNEQQVETLNNVVISGKHLLSLINDVLDMSKIESDSLHLFVSDDVSIADIIGDVITTGTALLTEKSVEINSRIEDDLPHIRGDQQRIYQSILNVVSNACKFTDEGSITITARKQDSEVVIEVSDTGSGIAEEDKASVFEAFKQTTTGLRQAGGTGLGMPITKSLIEAHGGTIDLESTVGQGTTFVIHLPVRSDILTPAITTKG